MRGIYTFEILFVRGIVVYTIVHLFVDCSYKVVYHFVLLITYNVRIDKKGVSLVTCKA